MDQVNLAKVGLSGVDGHPRAMLYSFTQMGIAFDSHTLNNSNLRHYFFGEPMNAILCNGNYSRF
ncbi:hypothetical protein AL035_21525 [Salipiger aestuarii]|nr:hypothetical protein AL035_21525 [Salipiger aestuarii]